MKNGFEEIDYTIKKSRQAKRWRIAVHRDASVILTMPARASFKSARRLIEDKADWIRSALARVRQDPRHVPADSLAADYARHKEAARALVLAGLKRYNMNYGFPLGRVAIRRARTRWGSCSGQGNLNFNYQILRLPAHLADYVLVHELCHLGELNHSPRFWKLVSQTIPDYKKIRRELKGLRLN